MNVVFEKELPESKEHEIISGIIDIFRENGVSFRQAFELLTATQIEIQKISLKPKMVFTPTDSSGTKYSPESIGIPCPITDRE